MIKVHPVTLAGKDFQNFERKENEKYPAVAEVFHKKQEAEYLTQWEVFTSAKHPEVCLEKTIESCSKVVLSKVFRQRAKFMNVPGLTLVACCAG